MSLASDAQDAQRAVTTALVGDVNKTWDLLDVQALRPSMPSWVLAIQALLRSYGLMSAHLAATFYRASRADAGVRGSARFPAPSLPAPEQVDKALSWATKGLWSTQPDVPAARTLVEGVTSKLVVDVARNDLIAAIEADTKARGWAREARPNACSWCAMLATRGAVYKSEASAMKREDGKRYHDNCHCLPVPLFADHYEPPAHVRAWQQTWRESTRGFSGDDAINAFRRALS